ncbi:Hypothetical protein, putative [Bodo saltans]|uniref:Uncharacterized protein n=1 Tax=Bodo saltans TaxID=75058 RepID=A0A0S4JKA3_BODSA|nr:Hypothetical protein, putative [Bodo saltans]|eukprot:CUG91926.1 Hypothetical protein, putative [Bodo saltans]
MIRHFIPSHLFFPISSLFSHPESNTFIKKMSYRNNNRDERGDSNGRREGGEGRRGPAGDRPARDNRDNRDSRPPRENRTFDAPQVDRTVEAFVSFARSILSGKQLGELSERLARRPQRQDAPRDNQHGEERRERGGRGGRGGRGRGGAEGGIPFGQNGGRGGRGGRGGSRADEGNTRPATAPSGQNGAPVARRNNRRPNITPQ